MTPLYLIEAFLTIGLGYGIYRVFSPRNEEPLLLPPVVEEVAPEPEPEPTPDPPIPHVIAAVMSAVNVGSMEGERANILHRILEEAEVQAVWDCINEGVDVHNAEVIIARKQLYRQKALEAFDGHQ